MVKVQKTTAERLGKNISKLRKAQKLTQQQLADKLGLTQAYMGHIEQGRKSPSLEVMEKIAKALRVSVKDLF